MEVDDKEKHSTPLPTRKTQFVWLSTFITFGLLFIGVYFILQFNPFSIPGNYSATLKKIALAGFFAIVILSVSKTLEIFIVRRSHSKYKRYNLIRLTHLASLVAVCILVVSFLFSNW